MLPQDQPGLPTRALAQSSRTARRTLLPTVVATFLACFLVVYLFLRSTARSYETEVLLRDVEAQASELNAPEWASISKQALTEEGRQKALHQAEELARALAELQRIAATQGEVTRVIECYRPYEAAMLKEFQLLKAGNVDAAKAEDEEHVDPAFEQLHEAIQQAVAHQTKRRRHTVLVAYAGSGVAILLSVGTIIFLHNWLIRSRHAVEMAGLEQRLMRETNQALHAEIAQRKQAEAKIREQATLLDAARDAIFVSDLEHRVMYWNKSAEEVFGWPQEEILGSRFSEVLFKDAPAKVDEACRFVLERGEWQGELTATRRNGHPVVLASRWTLIREENGRPKSILIINTDITEKKRLEAQFLRAQRLESIGTLAGGVAHDLNNVLTPILMSIDLLRLKLSSPADLQLMDSLTSSAQRGAGIVKQILSFARGSDGERSPVQLRYLIADLVKMAKETFPPSIRIHAQTPAETPTVLGDATQLYQVFLNLCVNARNAMPNGGTLELETAEVFFDEHFASVHPEAKAGPYATISIVDSGAGIPREFIHQIFDPFFTTKEFGKGTGLGLSTAVGIVKSHGGFIDVQSEVNKGTQFKVYLPAARPVERPEPKPRAAALSRGQGELVLVVEDEAPVRELAKDALECFGYRVLTASDGAEAIALYVKNQKEVKVVVTDMAMPYMDGAATIRSLRKINSGLGIVAASGFLEPQTVEELSTLGRLVFLPKPYVIGKLLQHLRELLDTG